MTILIGLEIGQSQRPSAICVTELQFRGPRGHRERHWVVRHLERLPNGTRYPEICRRLNTVCDSVYQQSGRRAELIVNVTGVGRPVMSLLESRVREVSRIIPIYFNQGDRRSEEGDSRDLSVTLGKAYLVSALQTSLQSGRLHLPRNEDCEILAQELMSYQIEVQPDANERYGAFRVGTKDDLVMALGLTVQHEPSGRTAFIFVGPRPAGTRPKTGLRAAGQNSWPWP